MPLERPESTSPSVSGLQIRQTWAVTTDGVLVAFEVFDPRDRLGRVHSGSFLIPTLRTLIIPQSPTTPEKT